MQCWALIALIHRRLGVFAHLQPHLDIGVGEKGQAPFQDLLCYGPDQDRIDVGVVAQLGEVDLDGDKVALFYDFGEFCSVK